MPDKGVCCTTGQKLNTTGRSLSQEFFMVNLVFLNDSWPDQWVADPNCGEATAMPRFVIALRHGTFARNLSNARELAWATLLPNAIVYQNFGKAIQISGIPCGKGDRPPYSAPEDRSGGDD